jgi:oxygen-independent coproporphyrinogen-3 oxidase
MKNASEKQEQVLRSAQDDRAVSGIYLSIPFCRQKCTYCNFASEAHAAELLPGYLHLLESEIRDRTALWPAAGIPARDAAEADSVYLGGGTPGLLTEAQLRSLMDVVSASFHVKHDVEITLEVSPENVTEASASAWAACGVNRISMGVQSMVTEELRAVGRMHDADTVRRAFAALRSAGIEDVSVDLIAGLPLQTAESWRASLESLLELRPAHFSVYMLEVDEDSRLGRELLEGGSRYRAAASPSEEQAANFYCAAVEMLRTEGYEHYEISNFARPGFESRHNLKYWSNAPYFGFGVDAHSYDGERRWANTDSLDSYLDKMARGESPVVECKTLDQRQQLEERLFLGLRRRDGVSLAQLHDEFALDVLRQYNGSIQEFAEAGWIERDGDRLRLTDRGVLFSNEVFAGFI